MVSASSDSDWQSRTRLLLGDDAVSCLNAARVIVFGAGGVGSWCVEALARAGVGSLTIVDSDTVVPSNINRQLVADTLTAGSPKVTAMARRIYAVNPQCHIHAICSMYNESTAPTFNLAGYDLVVDAIDSVGPKAHLIIEATRLCVPLVSSMGAALKTDITQIRVTRDFRSVQGDALARALRQRFKRTGVWPSRRFTCVYSPQQPPSSMQSEACAADTPNGRKRVNGTLVTTTAAFGLILAQTAIDSLL